MISFRRRKSASDLGEALDSEAFWADLRELVVPAVTPLFREALYVGMEVAKTQRPRKGEKKGASDVPAELLNRIADDFIQSYTDEWWAGIQASQSSALRTAIERSRSEGTGIEGILKAVDGVFSASRAEAIAVTETTRLVGRGAQLQYQSAGRERWEWLTVRDSHVCPTCEPRDGQTYPIEEPFEPAHVRCRCYPLPA